MQWLRCSIYALQLPFPQEIQHLHIEKHRIYLEVRATSGAAVACFGPLQSVIMNICTLFNIVGL